MTSSSSTPFKDNNKTYGATASKTAEEDDKILSLCDSFEGSESDGRFYGSGYFISVNSTGSGTGSGHGSLSSGNVFFGGDRGSSHHLRSFRNSIRDLHDTLKTSVRTSVRDIVVDSLRYGGARCSVRDVGGTASLATEIFNLTKNLVGCGMLSLPNGVASYGNSPSALIPAFFCTIFMGGIFGYYFLLIGRTCRLTHTATYREVWEATMGDDISYIVALVNAVKPLLGNLAYSMILADTFQSLFKGFLGWENCTRTNSLLLVTVVGLLPLCLLKNLKVLTPTSFIGTIGFVMSAVVMGIRYYDGTYSIENNGQFVKDLPGYLRPSFEEDIHVDDATSSWTSSLRVLIFICMLNEAFVAHYNAPRFYTELKDHTIKRFAIVCICSFGFSSILYYVIIVYGFLTFGKNCDGYILNNYSNYDPLANFVRLCIAIALVCTYPITFMGVRDGILDLFSVPMEKHTSTNLNILSIILLTIITIFAILFHDLGLVSAIGGGTLGTIVVFVFPALMFRGAHYYYRYNEEQGNVTGSSYSSIDVNKKNTETNMTKNEKYEINFSMILMWFGIVIGLIGVGIAFIE